MFTVADTGILLGGHAYVMTKTRFMLPGGIYDATENVNIKPLLIPMCYIEYILKDWTCFDKNPTTKIHFNLMLFTTVRHVISGHYLMGLQTTSFWDALQHAYQLYD